ncbi:MAG: carboxypeptidase-like regulatory domain-containing protein [Muribaculaceae bacterium]|nr:carboxypeptidase-like regulatory domain-containing protein [Muribaculaceae bacterium]
MKKRLLSALCLCLSVFATAIAEDVNYNGVVVSPEGTPIMGATVTVTGTEVSTMTDMDGKFSIVIPEGYSNITVSYAGMKKQTINVQREPVILYPTAADALAAQMKARKRAQAASSYKKNLFNLEVSYGSMGGDLGDIYKDYELCTDYIGLNMGWHHNYKEWIGWEIFNLGAMMPDDGEDPEEIIAYLTTGIRLQTPSWNKLSLFTSFNIGAAYNYYAWNYNDGASLAWRFKVGLNLGKWVYIAYEMDNISSFEGIEEYEYDYYYDGYNSVDTKDASFIRNSIAIGFNF